MFELKDCILIRKTTRFPENGIVQTPLQGKAYSFGPSLLGDAIMEELKTKYHNPEELIEEAKKYYTYFETKRSTIHFTINGAVADSLYGNFNYPYAILEPLEEHITDESLLGLRVEDTYFGDDMKLSPKAILLVPEEEVLSLENDYPDETIVIRTYQDSLDEAIEKECERLGYPFFEINNHGSSDALHDSPARDMYQMINNYAEEHNISQERHFYSERNKEDHNHLAIESEKTELEYLEYLFDNGLEEKTLKEKIEFLFPRRSYHQQEFNELLKELVNNIGLEKLEFLTKAYNQEKILERARELEQKKSVNTDDFSFS